MKYNIELCGLILKSIIKSAKYPFMLIDSFLRRALLLLTCLFFLLCITGMGLGQNTAPATGDSLAPPETSDILRWHEIFTYEVRYSFFKLGEVKVEVVGDTLYNGNKSWYIRTVITSNSGIPFVGREENRYNSIFMETDSLPQSQMYWRDNVDEEEYDDIRYEFSQADMKVYAREEDGRLDTLDLEPYGSSGQMSFIIGRLYTGTETLLQLPLYISLEKGYLTITNTKRMEKREYKAFEEPVLTYYSEGQTSIEGPFGFRGEFKSWYLADNLRVPLEAHVKVWLGNVRVKIIDYKKELRK